MINQTYEDIMGQIAELKAQADQIRLEEITAIKAKISEFGIAPEELGFAAAKPARRKYAKAPPVKYRDASGNTWTGRGKTPVWLRTALEGGASIEGFRVWGFEGVQR